MTEWTCTDCSWTAVLEPTDQPFHYCPECGGSTTPNIAPASLADVETQSDKV